MRRPRPPRGCCAMEGKKKYIYIQKLSLSYTYSGNVKLVGYNPGEIRDLKAIF
jgi:hypothetical protein